MPTYEQDSQFMNDWKHLSPEQRIRFIAAVREMVDDIKAKRPFRTSLRVKRFAAIPNYYEMSFEGDGRALFEFGVSPHPGDIHIFWHGIGGHEIFKRR